MGLGQGQNTKKKVDNQRSRRTSFENCTKLMLVERDKYMKQERRLSTGQALNSDRLKRRPL